MARANNRSRFKPKIGTQRRGVLFFLRRTIILSAGLVLLALAWLFYFAFTPLSIPETVRQLQVGPGGNYHSVARQLMAAGVLRERLSFIVLGRLQGRIGAVKAGIYALPETISPLALVQKLARGDVLIAEITF